jgi:hypothetical protein
MDIDTLLSVIQKVFLLYWRAQLLIPLLLRMQLSVFSRSDEGPMWVRLKEVSSWGGEQPVHQEEYRFIHTIHNINEREWRIS